MFIEMSSLLLMRCCNDLGIYMFFQTAPKCSQNFHNNSTSFFCEIRICSPRFSIVIFWALNPWKIMNIRENHPVPPYFSITKSLVSPDVYRNIFSFSPIFPGNSWVFLCFSPFSQGFSMFFSIFPGKIPQFLHPEAPWFPAAPPPGPRSPPAPRCRWRRASRCGPFGPGPRPWKTWKTWMMIINDDSKYWTMNNSDGYVIVTINNYNCWLMIINSIHYYHY